MHVKSINRWVHLFFNMLIQIIVGIPLEMIHGSCRIATVYTAGIVAGNFTKTRPCNMLQFFTVVKKIIFR